MKEISQKQKHALRTITGHIEKYGYPPTVQELSDLMGFTSKSTTHGYLERLEKKGYITREEGKPRALKVIKHA